MMVIYKITNKLNNKIYIGQTQQSNPWRRIRFHFKPIEPRNISLIWRAINKYGKDNFKVEIIFETQDLNELNKMEKQLIQHHNTLYPNGYNLQLGGQENKFTEETRKKISNANKGHTWLRGIPKTLEHRKAMSKSRKGFTSPARVLARYKAVEKTRKQVKSTHILTQATRIFKSIEEASRVLKITASNISRVCNGRQNRSQAGGYKFEFIF